jgi:hypothetical protein
MKNIFHFLIPVILLMNVCTDDSGNYLKAQAGKQSTTTTSQENIISFKVNGQEVTTSGWNISRLRMMGLPVLNVTSDMHEIPQTINININGNVPGTYKFLPSGGFKKDGYAYGSYFSNYKESMMNPFNFENGEFEIVSIDTTAGF